jgi:uncharacterized protein YchJ
MHVPGEYIIYFPAGGASGVLYAPDEPAIPDDAIGLKEDCGHAVHRERSRFDSRVAHWLHIDQDAADRGNCYCREDEDTKVTIIGRRT